jgi:hypothetical protein
MRETERVYFVLRLDNISVVRRCYRCIPISDWGIETFNVNMSCIEPECSYNKSYLVTTDTMPPDTEAMKVEMADLKLAN